MMVVAIVRVMGVPVLVVVLVVVPVHTARTISAALGVEWSRHDAHLAAELFHR